MFFKDKIKSISSSDKVLEIGPGATPSEFSTEFLEYRFENIDEQIVQRGSVTKEPNFRGRKITYYKGGQFPFPNKVFDYVIASHVIEHVDEPSDFIEEINRICKKTAYVEFPLPTLDYLYNYPFHKSYVWIDKINNKLVYTKKEEVLLERFINITDFFRAGFELGWDDLVVNNIEYFAYGQEFCIPIQIEETSDLSSFKIAWERSGRGLLRRLTRKLETSGGYIRAILQNRDIE